MGSRRRERGSALITALALVAVCTISMSGICILASSHSVRQRREADYALAMQLAEAGINYELRYVSTHLTTPPNAHYTATPYTGSVPGLTGSFTVYVTNTDGSAAWTAPSDMKVVATGTVGNITRKVTVVCKTAGGAGTPLFDGTFAVFGYQSILFTQSSNAISGNIGANGPPPASVAYSIGTSNNGVGNANSSSAKPLVLAAGATLMPGNSVNPNFTNNPTKIDQPSAPILWPTVDTIVASTFANGWTTLNSSSAVAAQWARIRMFRTQSRSMSPTGTKPITGVSSTSTTLDDSVAKNKAEDNQWVNAVILPPGDYYFTSIQLNRNNGYSGPAPVIYFDTNASSTGGTPGPVRLWIGGTSTASDTINMDIQYTSSLDSDKAKLSRMYYSKPANFTITGNNNFAGVYAVRKANLVGVSAATITLTQNSKITGAIIADNVVMTGGANVYSAGATMSNSADYSMGGGAGSYGFSGQWQEVSATNGAVFVDGTSR